MVRAIAGTCRVKLLSGFAGSPGENTLTQAQASRTGLASRRLASKLETAYHHADNPIQQIVDLLAA
jgi:hypothetical protein